MDDKKNKTIKAIEELMAREEQIIPVYMRHLESAIFWAGISEDSQIRAKTIMQVLIKESEQHKDMLERLLKYIKEKN